MLDWRRRSYPRWPPKENSRQIRGTAYPQRFRLDGHVSDERFDLKIELELLERNQKGRPPGTKFLFTYSLERDSGKNGADVAARGRPSKSDRKCKRTVWQTRNVANLGGGPMIMVRVPQCVEW
jgi:hypothetical protein